MSDPIFPLALADGYHQLPLGKVVTAVTYLQQFALPVRAPVPPPPGLRLEPWDLPDVESYLALYRQIGEPWLWYGRLVMAHDELALSLTARTTHILRAYQGETPVALIELDVQHHGDVEVLYFGITPGFTGQGLGPWMMDCAQRLAWGFPTTRRLWVHTCTADHPAAVPFYIKMGFAPYAMGIEIGDDPRLIGIYPEMSGPKGLPVIKPQSRSPSNGNI